jgi:hypothetical protein
MDISVLASHRIIELRKRPSEQSTLMENQILSELDRRAKLEVLEILRGYESLEVVGYKDGTLIIRVR